MKLKAATHEDFINLPLIIWHNSWMNKESKHQTSLTIIINLIAKLSPSSS